MKQYRVTYNVEVETADDCILSPDDPIHKLKEGQFLGKFTTIDVEEAEIIEDTDESI